MFKESPALRTSVVRKRLAHVVADSGGETELPGFLAISAESWPSLFGTFEEGNT
jgi:hypothetical protein